VRLCDEDSEEEEDEDDDEEAEDIGWYRSVPVGTHLCSESSVCA
jgi:hypothetical protein